MESGPAHVVVHGLGSVCWSCSRERDSNDWGLDQFEATVARVLAHVDSESKG